METPQEHVPHPSPFPTTPRFDPQDEKRPRAQRRAREVSSRYMMATVKSPSANNCSSGDVQPNSANNSYNCPPPPLPPTIPHKRPQQQQILTKIQRTPSVHHHQQTTTRRSSAESPRYSYVPSSPVMTTDSDTEDGSCFGDENRPDARNTPLLTSGQRNSRAPTTEKRRAVVSLFRENGEERRISRPGTPTNGGRSSSTPRPTPVGRKQVRPSPRELRIGGRDNAFREASGINSSASDREDECGSVGNCSDSSSLNDGEGEWCDSPPIRLRNGRTRESSECRTFMLDMDHQLPVRCSTDGRLGRLVSMDSSASHRGGGGGGGTLSIVHRSLNSALLNCQSGVFNPMKGALRPLASPRAVSSVNVVQELEAKKMRKVLSRQEDAHTLRLLEAEYLQWRFINARAEAATSMRRKAAEKSLYNQSVKLSDLQNSVTTKKNELQQLKQMRSLSSRLDAQMPYLDTWAALEADHSDSLSGTIKAALDACVRVPLIGGAKADIGQLSRVLGSANDVMDTLPSHIEEYLTEADRVGNAIFGLAGLVCKERGLVEELGDVLTEVQRLQVTECSLRASLMQLKHTNNAAVERETQDLDQQQS